MNVKISGKTLSLTFTLDTMDKIELLSGEALDVQRFVEELSDRKRLVDVLRIMADDDTVSAEWLKKHIRPGQLPSLQVAILDTITEYMHMETEDDQEETEVDVVLEDIKKKDEAGA